MVAAAAADDDQAAKLRRRCLLRDTIGIHDQTSHRIGILLLHSIII